MNPQAVQVVQLHTIFIYLSLISLDYLERKNCVSFPIRKPLTQRCQKNKNKI